jgi:SHS2 domain-containing protein
MPPVPALGRLRFVVHRFVEHVGEVELELEAASEDGIFAAALTAFADLVAADGEGDPALHEIELTLHEIELTARDHALLLIDWLSELVFLAEVEQFVPERIAAFELGQDQLRATVAGRHAHPRHLVKAVTLNNLELAEKGGSWHGRVVLDV